MNLLDDFSALHNLRQREGLNPVSADSVSDYILERRLIRAMYQAAEHEGILELAGKTGLAPMEVRDVVEQHCYCLPTEVLRVAVKVLDEQDVYQCIKHIHDSHLPDFEP